MKTIGKRKTASGPCKSPSPDLYHRSIIKGTTIEVDNIRTKMKQAEQRQQLFELQSSYSQNLPSELNISLDGKYRQLYEELNKLKNQNKYLAEQNLLLNQENKRFTLNDQRSKTISQLTGALLSKNQKEPLKQRLEKEIAALKAKQEQSQKLIQGLQTELQSAHQEVSRLTSQSNCLYNHENRLTLLSNNIINSFDQTLKFKLQQLNSRINKVELMEKIIKQQHSRLIADSRIQRTPTSFKKQERDTLSTSFKQHQDEPSLSKLSRSIYPYNPLQESIQRFEQENALLLEALNNKEHEIRFLKEENDRISSVLKKLQREKSKIKLTPPKSKDKTQSDTIKRTNELEDSIKSYRDQLQSMRNQKTYLHKELEQLQQKHDSEKRGFLQYIDNLQKIVDAHQDKQKYICQVCLDKDQQIASLNVGNQQLSMELQNIKSMVSFLQETLRISQFKELLQQNYQIYDEVRHSWQTGSQSFKQIQDLKEKLLGKEGENYRLVTELALKTREVELLTLELEKLRQMNNQLVRSSRQVERAKLMASSAHDVQRNAKFKRNHEQIVGRLKNSSQKLGVIQDKIRIQQNNASSSSKVQ